MIRRRGDTSATAKRDAGFTLPEMLLAVMFTGIIAVVIAAAVIVSFRAFPDTEARADTAITLQGLTTWLPPDVDSANPGEFVTSDVPSGCASVDAGVNVLHLRWEETAFDETTNYVVSYRFVAAGANSRLVRVSCSGQPTLGAASALNVTGSLPEIPPTVTLDDSDDADDLHDSVLFKIVTLAGSTVYIDAVSKNPNETLPPLPPTVTPTTVNSPPTALPTSATTTELAPVDVTLQAGDPNGSGSLVATVVGVPPELAVTVSGLVLTITPAVGTAASSFTFQYTVTDPQGLSATNDVTVDVTAVAVTTTTTATTTTIPPPCVLGSMTVSPASMALKGNDPSALDADVTVEITIDSGYCVGLTLQYDTQGPGSQYVQNFGSTALFIITLRGTGAEKWSLGSHVLEARDGANNLLGTSTLTTT
jgi:Tfp pilus assembly protein PilV